MNDFKSASGNIETRLISNKEELNKALKLRYESLILEYNSNNTNPLGIDYDPIDDHCDHLIALDTDTNEVVGTYRLLRKEHCEQFICEKEYNIDKLKTYKILEISRAVVRSDYRDGNAIKLLWKSIIQYAVFYDIDYMIGTASFHGVDWNMYKHCFSYLYYNHLTPSNLLCYAYEPYKDLNILSQADIDLEVVKHQMPPLVKGYLRLGCTIGAGIYIDVPFNSLDVLIVLEIKTINPRYLKKFLGFTYE